MSQNPLTTIFYLQGHKSVRLYNALSPLTTDTNSNTRKYVCKALCELTKYNFNEIIEMIEQIINFMLKALEDDDEEIIDGIV